MEWEGQPLPSPLQLVRSPLLQVTGNMLPMPEEKTFSNPAFRLDSKLFTLAGKKIKRMFKSIKRKREKQKEYGMTLKPRRIVGALSSFISLSVIILMSHVSWCAEFQFKCPEHMTTNEERDKHLKEFLVYCTKEHPDWTVGDVLNYRMKLLEENNCRQTLENIRNKSPNKPNEEGESKRDGHNE